MKFNVLLAMFACMVMSEARGQLQKLAVLGSSTAAGTGANPAIDSSWVRRVNHFYKVQNSVVDTVYNLAVGGYDPYRGLPTSYITPQYYSTPDPLHNITRANSLGPDVIIVSFVSNLYQVGGIPIDSILHSLQVIKDSANKEGRVCFITTSQPRSQFDAPSRERLRIIKDSILNRFGYYAINFYDSIVNPIDNKIKLQFSAGDDIHINNAGHAMLYRQVIAKKIFEITTTRTRRSGDFNDPLIWDKGIVPGPNDSVAVTAGHTLVCTTPVHIKALTVASEGSLVINDSLAYLQVGDSANSNHEVKVSGSLMINKGKMLVYGRLKQEAASVFEMSKGELIIDGNSGGEESSVADGLHLFDMDSSIGSFSFSGGSLQFVDPPLGANSQCINSTINFGANSVVKFGNGISMTASNNQNGFGGNLMPAEIGNLVLDAATKNNNRLFRNLNILSVKQSVKIFSGNFVQAAEINLGF